MPDLSQRSREPEVIDDPAGLSGEAVEQILRELELVNRWLGGTAATLGALAPFLTAPSRARALRIVDIGTGSADIPLALLDWCRRRPRPVRILAIDHNPAVCRLARRHTAGRREIDVVQADLLELPLREKGADFILCSAFLHHFDDRRLQEVLTRLKDCAATAVIWNDLQRHRVAYWSIRILTRLFSRSAAVRHDGPLSVCKGFRRQELVDLLTAAGCRDFEIRWRWAFRWVVVIRG